MSLSHADAAYLYDTQSRQVCRPIPAGAFHVAFEQDVFQRYETEFHGFPSAAHATRHWNQCRALYPNHPRMAAGRVITISRSELYAQLGFPDPVLQAAIDRSRLVSTGDRAAVLL